jgi:hypothetical protein
MLTRAAEMQKAGEGVKRKWRVMSGEWREKEVRKRSDRTL